MIDTDKYEGRTPGQWSVTSIRDGSIPWNTADEELCADAPLLLEEVKRLRELLESVVENATEPSGDDGTDYRYCEVDAELVEMIEEEMNRLVKE
jgi:hypothetical protein